MGEVIRYVVDARQSPEGQFVAYHDYAALEAERDALKAEVLLYRNTMGRIAIALFGDQNTVTDEACIARAASVVEQLADADVTFNAAMELAEHTKGRVLAAKAEVARLSAACAAKDAALRMLDTYMAHEGNAPLDGDAIKAALSDTAGRNYIDATGAVNGKVAQGHLSTRQVWTAKDAIPDDWAGTPVMIVPVRK